MRKSFLVLLLGVLLPSLILGWLALRGAEEQQYILARSTTELLQKDAEQMAASVRGAMEEQRRAFDAAVLQLLAQQEPAALAGRFPEALAAEWHREAIGFAIDPHGRLVAPTPRAAETRPAWQQFLWDNGAFLGNKSVATVYAVPAEQLSRPESRKAIPESTAPLKRRGGSIKAAPGAKAPSQAQAQQQAEVSDTRVLVMKQPPEGYPARNVIPQQSALPQWSLPPVAVEETEFRQLTAGEAGGMVNRFVQDRLRTLLWSKPVGANGYTFGCQLSPENLQDLWGDVFPQSPSAWQRSRAPMDRIMALLNDKGRPVAVWPAGAAAADWRRPFVASEIGEFLPHWEAAVYLADPGQLQASARTMRRTLSLLILAALSAIALGGAVVLMDTRRQLRRAQQKTDFVSNVSHELKTPLTSIRMFAELMHTGRASEEKRVQYTRIIMVEAERLTRLINNVLDFARMERRPKPLQRRELDLLPVLEELWSQQEVHLREGGFVARWKAAPGPYRVLADADAICQILVNLFSNAEKYSGETREVELQTFIDEGMLHLAVLDRGTGLPPGEERKIFEPFYRAHDSLSSGIQGTGLGLTLAQRLAREHGGGIHCSRREGGGMNFTLRLPLLAPPAAVHDPI